MPTIRKVVFALVLAAGVLAPARVLATKSRTAIPHRDDVAQGGIYAVGQKIERDDEDGFWETDDAYGSDGRKWGLIIQPETLEIIGREPE